MSAYGRMRTFVEKVAGKAKVRYADVAIFCEKYVGGFQVTVDDATRMRGKRLN